MKSMTGYAWEERQDEQISLSIEIKGYNSRYLELFIYLPPYLSSLEPKVREYMASRCRRGKVEVNIRFKEYNADISVSVNREAARAYGNAISTLAQILGTQEKPSLSSLLGLEGVLEIEKNRDDERNWRYIMPCLKAAADVFDGERLREGSHTQEDILSHIAILESSVRVAAAHAPMLETAIQENLKNRFTELLGDKFDENRILAETAVLLMKYTISEEISRLGSHLSEFRAEAERNPSPGKKLDFLCQEMNREVNTIGSKIPDLAVSRAVVDMKDALENIREQLRNVE
ncbi:MAG: YicC family protein [Spirochaetaceae bacterium]|jgi:uncharacterized protein (TIGR00255 family)|nr:YicC family protein [Spirochaetaceae bacterium]